MIHLSRYQKQLFTKIYKANTLDCSDMTESQLRTQSMDFAVQMISLEKHSKKKENLSC